MLQRLKQQAWRPSWQPERCQTRLLHRCRLPGPLDCLEKTPGRGAAALDGDPIMPVGSTISSPIARTISFRIGTISSPIVRTNYFRSYSSSSPSASAWRAALTLTRISATASMTIKAVPELSDQAEWEGERGGEEDGRGREGRGGRGGGGGGGGGEGGGGDADLIPRPTPHRTDCLTARRSVSLIRVCDGPDLIYRNVSGDPGRAAASWSACDGLGGRPRLTTALPSCALANGCSIAGQGRSARRS